MSGEDAGATTGGDAGGIGFGERLRRLEDEAAIRDLAARFADAATRGDIAAFEALWWTDARWSIDPPVAADCEGIGEITALLRRLRGGRAFFVQLLHSGVVEIDGDRATARWILQETAKGPGDHHYRNEAMFEDRLSRRNGEWRFSARSYRYLHLDLGPFPGEVKAPPAVG